MILERLDLTPDECERLLGWRIEAEGACQGERCVPLRMRGERIDVSELAAKLTMPLVRDEAHEVWSLGPESADRTLSSARMPPLTLPDLEGRPFDLASLLGKKVLLLAWASW